MLGNHVLETLENAPMRSGAEAPSATCAARFSGDVYTVEALFTSGIISMVADACRIVSILAVIAVKNTGLALVLVLDAIVVGVVMLLSASGNRTILHLFGMSVGTSVAVINYISRIFAPIESLGMEIPAIQSAMSGVKRIDAFLAQPERDIPREQKQAARGDVVLSHMTFGYGEKTVLRDFSLTVKQGEQVTLVGRTGAGKSTVFRLLLGLYSPEAGTVTIGSVNVSVITDQERRACISCVEQHFSRLPGNRPGADHPL